MNEKKTYTADEFKAICRDMIPALDALRQVANKNGLDYIHVTINSDGYTDVSGSCFSGWELTNAGDDGVYTARYSYEERFTMDGEVPE